MWFVVSGGIQIDTAIAHGCKKFEEKKNNVTGRENQEIHGGVLADLVEKAWHTANTGKASIVVFRVIYDDKQGQGIFDEEGLDPGGWAVESKKNLPYTSESTR